MTVIAGRCRLTSRGTPKEIERRNRIRLSVAAYSYEFEAHSIMSDAEFDALALKIDPTVSTGKRKLDKFFREVFKPDTGMWIRDHPDLGGIKALYEKHYVSRKDV